MGWTKDKVAVAYDERLLDWHLGPNHPTNPERARIAVRSLEGMEVPHVVEAITADSRANFARELELVHAPEYVRAVTNGYCAEWGRERRADLGDVARHMFAGTVQLVDGVLDGDVKLGFTPQGAKHHAMHDTSSGFCVFNDFAYAAYRFAREGHRVLYVDWDAHHGDGVEALTYAHPDIMTASIHDSTIFPGSGNESYAPSHVYNFPLALGAGDAQLHESLQATLTLARGFDPTVILLAAGADGHNTDPLSTLQYTVGGIRSAAYELAYFAYLHDLPVLIGGAGGYQPLTFTPAIWAITVKQFADVMLPDRKVRGPRVHRVQDVI